MPAPLPKPAFLNEILYGSATKPHTCSTILPKHKLQVTPIRTESIANLTSLKPRVSLVPCVARLWSAVPRGVFSTFHGC
jgi:hypothetical protein